ncbi:MAG TPA: DUF523 domain-containing protein [Deltaproteobacteria bacterium]|jgi:uncharacterized protein YbbK (DUF523 family)|nr:DUF523 domain-containing protein [Deltaproteobacteria bacterium]HOI06063.1 DUF523 domain-containing protein [Deltaproteobacteria bacterium]
MPDKPAPGHLTGPVLVSACLLGIPCRYDGASKPCHEILEAKGLIPIPVCPEQLGGFPTPRPKAFFAGGDGRDVLRGAARVLNERGEDVTAGFVNGAWNALKIAQLLGVRLAVLKEGSPSCGVNSVTVDGRKKAGIGVTAALLAAEGIDVRAGDGS